MKKIILLLSAIIIFTLPIQQNYLEAEAAILSKAASKTAQKIAKEVIKDSAINQAIKIASDESKRLKDPSRMTKEGYMMFCMDYTYKPGDKCAKPSSIKANLTETDKANIGKQANVEMDKLISPDGKGFSKWAKFLDWFAPIWLISAGIGALTYALNDDVASLFDEAAYNTLVALGLIAPVSDATAIPLEEVEPVGEPNEDGDILVGGKFEKSYVETYNRSGGSNQKLNFTKEFGTYYVPIYHTFQNTGLFTFTISNNPGNDVVISNLTMKAGSTQVGGYNSSAFSLPANLGVIQAVALHRNGEEIYQGPMNGYYSNPKLDFPTTDIYPLLKKIQSIRARAPYEIGGFWYTDVLYNTTSGDSFLVQTKSTEGGNNRMVQVVADVNTIYSDTSYKATVGYFPNVKPTKEILITGYDELENGEFNAIENSSYSDGKGNIALLPPAAFTYEEESTGEQVERVKAPTGDGFVWQKPDGTQVPEENIVPREEEEPKITPAPDGTPQYTPAPTPSNPTPEPEPLTPDPAGPTAPPAPEEPPATPFPDGEKCTAKLQFPVFSPLKEQLSTSFPFSIPWDIERAAHAAFDGVGNEKPKFDMVIPMGDKKHHFTIETPKFLDDWKPFMDGFLLLSFDMLLMFGLYRFVKGAGS